MPRPVPLLSVVSLSQNGGGIAAVARLLWEALGQRFPEATLLRLIRGDHAQPTLADKVRYALTLGALQASGQVDSVIYAHVNLAKPLGSIPATLIKPYTVFLHGIEAWCPLPERQLDQLAGAQLRIANSAYTAARVMQAHPSIGHVEACPLALPRRDTPTTSRRSSLSIGEHAVLIVGRLSAAERYKGHDELIETWPEVVAAVPDATLVIAGDGDDAPRLKEKARATGLGSSILFTGFVADEELDALYRDSAVFAMPSRGEGFGLVYLEAMQRNLPCIGSIHDAARDVIVHGQTGLLVDQGRPGELANSLVTLLRDDDLRVRMGRLGHARLNEEFTADRFRHRLFSLLGSTSSITAAA